MRTHRVCVVLTCLFSTLTLSACGSSRTGTSGQATFKMSNSTGALLSSSILYRSLSGGFTAFLNVGDKETPTVFKFKMLGAGIAQGEDTRVSPASAIYVNPDCTREDLESQDADGTTFKYVGFNACNDTDVSTFFDLALPTDQVNTHLNAQKLPILPGTYTHVFLSYCLGSASAKNLKFQTASMPSEVESTQSSCSTGMIPLASPITVTEGQAVIATITYDLTDAVTFAGNTSSASSQGCAEAPDANNVYCASFPTIVPSVTLE